MIVAVDDTLERRFDRCFAHQEIYLDAVRSKPGHPATTTGIRWLCCTTIVHLPWSSRAWALPFLTIPAPSLAVSIKLCKVHHTVPGYAALLVGLPRRWLPDRPIVLVGDSSFGFVELALECRLTKVTWVARMCMTAALYAPAPPQPKGKPGVEPKERWRRATPPKVLANPATKWDTIAVHCYYGEMKTFDAFSQTAHRHRDGVDPVPVRWVWLRDPSGALNPMVPGCTAEAASPEHILNWYIGS